ncbi:hypothetical protein GCM10009687_18760 [Asanoa iriomotensis]|uniref:Uncharacterized protein n=1 Tax=Asanoa iriomotensis TaxID=234613 RepID=A0ABQ4C5S0_9ACTN|nr:hypothetical protein Air01nite_42280 [Asanoa iriomotensis]
MDHLTHRVPVGSTRRANAGTVFPLAAASTTIARRNRKTPTRYHGARELRIAKPANVCGQGTSQG